MKKNILYLILGLIFIFGFILFLGSYSLLDVDETRYVDMAKEMFKTKDFMTLYLNGEYFFEKPPLFFWLECISFKVFGIINEFSARIPVVIISLLPAFLLFQLCKKVKNIKFAFIAVCTLLTSFQYVIITKIAILDSVFTSFVSASCLCYFYTFFVKEKNKKYFWFLTYIFSALAVLAKGLPGVIIPFLVVLISSYVFKTNKEFLKYSAWGIILFLIISLPWHIIMLKMYNSLFFQEYIYKHHILRFLGSVIIDRTKPWYFYIQTVLWGFFPHIFILLASFADKKLRFNIKQKGIFEKFLILNVITALVIFLFFSMSKGKLMTYIVPLYPFLAVITGYIWYKYIISENIFVKRILICLNIIILIAAVIVCFAKFVLNSITYNDFVSVQISLILLVIPFCIYNIFLIKKKKRLKTFISLCIFMSLFIGIMTPVIYNFNYSFGQKDLIEYAQMAKNNNSTISTYLTGKRYSLLFYSGLPNIEFHLEEDTNWLIKELEKENNILIVKNQDINKLPISVNIVKQGRKYSVISCSNKNSR